MTDALTARTVYRCPLCEWSTMVTPPTPDDLVWVAGDSPMDTLSASIHETLRQQAIDTGAVIAEHVSTHTIREALEEIARLNWRLEAVRAVCGAAESGEFATAGRDFGRGAAEVTRRVREALATTGDTPCSSP